MAGSELGVYMGQVYQQLSVSSLGEDGGVGIYVVNDAADKDVKYDLIVQVISWKVC